MLRWIKAAWQKWKDLSGVVCDKKMSVRIKGKIYKTMIRPVMIYGAKTWALKKKDEEHLERTEMRMLHWILGVSQKDHKRNEDIRKTVGVACITEKVREARLRWYGHGKKVRTTAASEELWRQRSMDIVAEVAKRRDGSTWFQRIPRSSDSPMMILEIVTNGEGEPVWLTPHLRD